MYLVSTDGKRALLCSIGSTPSNQLFSGDMLMFTVYSLKLSWVVVMLAVSLFRGKKMNASKTSTTFCRFLMYVYIYTVNVYLVITTVILRVCFYTRVICDILYIRYVIWIWQQFPIRNTYMVITKSKLSLCLVRLWQVKSTLDDIDASRYLHYLNTYIS